MSVIRMIASRLFGPRRRAVASMAPVPAAPPGFPADPYDAQQRIMAALGEPAPVIFDIGAHKGTAAQEYRSRFPGAAIYCFEPFPDSVAVLRDSHAGDPAITVVPMAVSDRPGRRTFFINGFDATHSLLPRPADSRRYYPQHAGPKTRIEVDTTSLDAFVNRENLHNVAILKLDIQGGELMALQGAAHLLRTGAVRMIYTEIQFVHLYEKSPLLIDLWSYLAPFGFHLFDIYNLHRARNGQLRYGDALFVHDRVRSQCIDRGPEEP